MGIKEIPERALNAPLPARIVIVIILFSIGLMAGLAMAEDKFGFTWTPLMESIGHKEYLITTDKTADINESFSVLFNETSFMPEDIRNVRLYTEKAITWNETIFIREEQEQTCYNELNEPYTCLKNVSVPNGTIERTGNEWKDIGFIVKEKTNKDAKIKFDVKKFKKHDRYKLAFDTPIQITGAGFGSTGSVAFLVDEEIHCPIWDTTGWTKYKEINITNNVASDISNFQVLLNVTHAASMQADFDDLRFIWVNNSDSTDERELNYFIENKVDSDYADVWINNTFITASSSVIVKMYYGNPGVSSLSNGSLVFNFFDDFADNDITDWTVNGGTWSASGGIVSQTGDLSAYGYLYKTGVTYPDPFILESKIRPNTNNLETFGIELAVNAANEMSLSIGSYSNTRFQIWADGSSVYDLTAMTAGTWYNAKIEGRGSTVYGYIDGDELGSGGVSYNDPSMNRIQFVVHQTQDYASYDFVRLREYVATEPTSVFGSEQDISTGDPLVKLTFDLANGLDASGYGNNATVDNSQWLYTDKCAGAYNITLTEQIKLFTAMLNKTYTDFAYCIRAKSVWNDAAGEAGGQILDASDYIYEPRKLMLIRFDDGRIYYSVHNKTGNYNTTNPYGEWESFCLSSNGTNQEFYYNGIEVSNNSYVENLTLNTTLNIGNPWVNVSHFYGQVDDFYFWNRTIAAAEALSFNASCDNNFDLAAYDGITNESLTGYAVNISDADYANISNVLNLTLAPGNYSLIFSLANYSSKSADVSLVTVLFYNASLYPLRLFDCGIYEDVIPTLNFSVYDEEILIELNGTIELVFNLLEEGFYATNQSWNLTSTPLTICIPENVTYTITDSIIQYTAPDHTLRHYFLMDFSINSTMQTIPLYSLATANGTEITINIRDAAGSPVSDAIIIFQRYYIGEDVYRISAMARTDYNGQAVTNVRQDDVWHKLLILKDLIVRRTIDRMIITETTLNIPYIDEGQGQAFYNYYNNIATTCTANTTLVTCIATDTTGATQTFQLDVYRIGYNNVGRVLTCTDTETSSSATLSCAVSHNNSYYTLSAVGSHYRLNDGYINVPTETYGIGGVVLAAGIVMTMVGIGAFNPVAAIGLGLVGLILAVMTDVVVMKAAALVSLILVGIILMAKMRG